MKIAIQSNKPRGKEIISLLESLGGKNTNITDGTLRWRGDSSDPILYYYIDRNGYIQLDPCPKDYKSYTLEEFEKEFPFKVGDEVIFPVKVGWASGKITGLTYVEDQLKYEVDDKIAGYRYIEPHKLNLYPMKEERNITLTLDKAKEWYKKGGELKEIALQAFSEKELNPLPRSWEEFITNRSISGYYISGDGKLLACCSSGKLSSPHVCPSQKSAEAHLALIQLEQLRDCWRQGNIPQEFKYKIKKIRNKYTVVYGEADAFLSFCDKQTAEEFLKCFRNLIEQAVDLI